MQSSTVVSTITGTVVSNNSMSANDLVKTGIACRLVWTCLLWTASPPAWPTATKALPHALITFGRCALTGAERIKGFAG